MRWFPVVVLLALAGCLATPERLPLQPLPEKEQVLDYREIVLRARLYALAANEAFYVNQWADIDEAARNLDQAARLLVKASDVPPGHKDKLEAYAAELTKEAGQLRKAAKAQDVQRTNDLLQRIHLKIRDMRAEN